MAEAFSQGVRSLLDILPVKDDHGKEQPRLIQLSGEALNVWERFSQDIETEQAEGGRLENQQDLTGKLPGQALRIAGICQIAKSVDSGEFVKSTLSTSSLHPKGDNKKIEIESDTIRNVIDLCKKLIVHAQAGFDLLEDDLGMADAKWTLKWITVNAVPDEKGAFYIRQNGLHCSSRFKNGKLDRVLKAIQVLHERNILSSQVRLATRKPTSIYYVNPAFLEKFSPIHSRKDKEDQVD